MTKELEKKVNQAIKLLQSIPQDKGQITLAYSGGKDSDVCLELCKMAGIPFKAVYHSTTIDPPGTIKHVINNGVEIVRPRESFFALVRKKGYPSRFVRYCCRELKEKYDSDISIQGIRASESKARADRYKEPEQCRVFDKKHKSRVYMPILFWTDDDVSEFVSERGVKCHALYYSGGGILRRVKTSWLRRMPSAVGEEAHRGVQGEPEIHEALHKERTGLVRCA